MPDALCAHAAGAVLQPAMYDGADTSRSTLQAQTQLREPQWSHSTSGRPQYNDLNPLGSEHRTLRMVTPYQLVCSVIGRGRGMLRMCWRCCMHMGDTTDNKSTVVHHARNTHAQDLGQAFDQLLCLQSVLRTSGGLITSLANWRHLTYEAADVTNSYEAMLALDENNPRRGVKTRVLDKMITVGRV